MLCACVWRHYDAHLQKGHLHPLCFFSLFFLKSVHYLSCHAPSALRLFLPFHVIFNYCRSSHDASHFTTMPTFKWIHTHSFMHVFPNTAQINLIIDVVLLNAVMVRITHFMLQKIIWCYHVLSCTIYHITITQGLNLRPLTQVLGLFYKLDEWMAFRVLLVTCLCLYILCTNLNV